MPRHTTDKTKAKYAGIDFHKKTSVVAIGDKHGKLVDQVTLINENAIVERYFKEFVGLECVIESCRGYEWLIELLEELGHTVHMGDSRSIKLIAQTRCKTDKIDSKLLMELLAKDYLPKCYQPTAQERVLRELVRHRAQLVRTAVKHKLRIHAHLDKENKSIFNPFSLRGREKLRDVDLTPGRREQVDDEIEIIDYLELKVAEQDAKIKYIARTNPDVALLKTMPGFDVLTSIAFLAEVGDISRFRKADQVAAFLGLVPRVYSSGNTRRNGRITKCGSKLMRWMLVQSAWSAIRVSPNLRQCFSTISRRKGQKVAIVAVARKLATIGFHILKEKVEYKEALLDAGLDRAAF
jgi:transposase